MVAKLLFSFDEIILETFSMFDWEMMWAYKLLQIQYHWCYLLLLIVVQWNLTIKVTHGTGQNWP